MEKNITRIQLFLLLFLLLSCFFNLYGIQWGLPALWYPDESETIEDIVIPMARNLDLNPHVFRKTSFYYYFLQIFLAPYFLYLKIAGIAIKSYTDFVGTVTFISRIVTALTGMLGVFLMYLLGKNLRNEKVGLIAALLLATSLGYVSYAHFAMMEILMLVLVMGTTFFFFRYLENLTPRYLHWASFIGGLAVSTKYNAALFIVISLFVCHFVRVRSEVENKLSLKEIFKVVFSRELFFSFGFLIFGFLIGTPFSVLDYKTFWTSILKHIFYSKGYIVFEESYVWVKNFSFLKNGFGYPLFILMGFAFFYGLIQFLRKPSGKKAVVFLPPLLYYVYIGSWRITAFRYVLPIVPFLILSGGLFIFHAWQGRKIWRTIVSIVVGGIIVYSLAFTFLNIRCFNHDTREIATQWIAKHVEEGSRVEVYSSKAYLPRFSEQVSVHRISPNFVVESIRYEQFRKSRLGVQLLGEADDDYGRGDNRSEFTLGALGQRNPDYIVLSSFYYTRYLRGKGSGSETPYSELDMYFRQLVRGKTGYTIVATFQKDGMQSFYLNPTILVLERIS